MYSFLSQVMRRVARGIPVTQAFLALLFFIFKVWPFFPFYKLAAGAGGITSAFHEGGKARGKGLFRKAHPVTSIPETRIVLEGVVISKDHFCCHQSVGSVIKGEKKEGRLGGQLTPGP